MSLIQISDLTFGYDGSYETIFHHVNLQLDTDWKLGLIGRNGRGKTTLFHLLMGKYPYQGKIHSSITFQYFPYPVEDKSLLTVDVVSSVVPDCPFWQMKKELSYLRVSEEALYRPFETLSNGEQTKVLLAALFSNETHFLLIDEPTNHLDQEARELVSNYLNGKKGFILISHDRAFLDGCVDHILSINRANIELQKGNYTSWAENKRRQDAFEMGENEKLKKDIKRLEMSSRQTESWSNQVEKTKYASKNGGVKPDRGYIGHKAAKMMKRSKNAQSRKQQAIEEKEKLLRNIESAEPLKMQPILYHHTRLIEAKDFSLYYGEKKICGPLCFTLEQGDRLALKGKNGSGKTSLLNYILGESVQKEGTFIKASGLVISYVSQDTSFLRGSLTDYGKAQGLEESLWKAVLRKLDFSREQFDYPMETYSAGQKKKVILAASLCQKAHIYLWDEPLNYIDMQSRIQIEELLTSYKPTMIFVEHDRVFMEKVATKILQL